MTEVSVRDIKTWGPAMALRDQDRVAELIESIKEIGLINPITVRRCRIEASNPPRDGFSVIAGCHRLEAVKQLGWQTIPCQVVELDDLHAELALIDENLIRRVLSPAEKAHAIARRKTIYEEIHPEARKASLAVSVERSRQDKQRTICPPLRSQKPPQPQPAVILAPFAGTPDAAPRWLRLE